ncbi:MAG: sulfatase family protein, partial [Vicinamibacterales bacterium]
VPADRPIDGADVMPLLTGGAPAPEREFFYFSAAALHAVRSGRWKLRFAPSTSAPAPVVELFDLEVDPSERYNVAGEHGPVVERLRRRLEEFRTEIARDQQASAPKAGR